MALLQDNFIHRIVVVKFDKSKATLLAVLLVRDDASRDYVSELAEVIPQVFFVEIVAQPADEQLLYRCASLRSVNVLPRDGPLWFHHAAVDLVRSLALRFVHHVRLRVGDEAETAAALGLGVLHDHHIDHLAPLLEVGLQGFVRGAVVQTSDEQFAQVLWLADFFIVTSILVIAILLVLLFTHDSGYLDKVINSLLNSQYPHVSG